MERFSNRRMRLWLLMPVILLVGMMPVQAQRERYVAPPEGEIVYTAIPESGSSYLYLINSDGTDNHPITSGVGADVTPRWSWDGSTIIYNERDEVNTFYMIDAQGQNRREVFSQDGFSPMLSPDNSMVVFMMDSNIQIAEVGSEEATVLTAFSFAYVPAWSPDGQTIAFVVQDQGQAIWTMNADGTDQRMIYDTQSNISGVNWSPDGKSLAFGLISGDTASLFVMNANGEDVRQITDPTQYRASQPSWSANGQWLAFQRRAIDPDNSTTLCVTEGEFMDQVFIIDINGNNLQQVTTNGGCYPSWRPE